MISEIFFCLLQGRQYYVQISAYNMKGWGPAQLSQPPSAVPSSKFCKASTVPKYCIKGSFIQKHTTVSNIIDWKVLEPLTTALAVRFVLLIQISCLLKWEEIVLIVANILGCRVALLFNYHDLYSPAAFHNSGSGLEFQLSNRRCKEKLTVSQGWQVLRQ